MGKAIDKTLAVRSSPNATFTETRARLREMVKAKGLTHKQIDAALGNPNSHKASHYLGESQPQLPTPEDWVILKRLLCVDEEIQRSPARDVWLEFEREVVGQRSVQRGVAFSSDGKTEVDITAPATEEARRWEGWGTALKPSYEPIVVARKPLSEKSVAANVLRWNCGALNIDQCRVGTNEQERAIIDNRSGRVDPAKAGNKFLSSLEGNRDGDRFTSHAQGRWPSNTILSHAPSCQRVGTKRVRGSHDGVGQSSSSMGYHGGGAGADRAAYTNPDGLETVEEWRCVEGCAVAEMDAQSGTLKSNSGKAFRRNGEKFPNNYGTFEGAREEQGY